MLWKLMDRFFPQHDDAQGVLGTALTGVTTWTPAAYRSTGIVMNEIASGDVFTMIFQFAHRKKLGTALDGVHIHYIPMGSANGDIAFTYSWGWYNHGDTVPNTLPNTGTVADITLATTDQYKLKINQIVTNLSAPASEAYSSLLFIRIVAAAPADGTNWWTSGGTNRIALAYVDAHYITDRGGSRNETTD